MVRMIQGSNMQRRGQMKNIPLLRCVIGVSLVVFALVFAAWASPALAALPEQTTTATRTPRPTRTPRLTATPRLAVTTVPATINANPNANTKLNPATAFALAQKDPCGLVSPADAARLLNVKSVPSQAMTRDDRAWCEYGDMASGLAIVEIDHDEDGRVLAKDLARFAMNNGCGRDKTPSEADMQPFTSKPLIDKLKLLVEQANKCGSKYIPVGGLGMVAFTDAGNLIIVDGKYLMNAYVQLQAGKADEQARRLATLAFAR